MVRYRKAHRQVILMKILYKLQENTLQVTLNALHVTAIC
jgi:hypothetical protein